MLTLRLPQAEDRDQVLAYRQAFLAVGDHLDGTNGLRDQADFEVWLASCQANLSPDTVPSHLVPATTFLAFDSVGQLVGMIDLRHQLNAYLAQYGGHIGYSVHTAHRRKGYAKGMLAQVLLKAKQLGLSRVLITCDRENVPSQRTILSQGGVMENEVLDPHDGQMTQRYWVDL